MITAQQLRTYAQAWKEGAERLHQVLPESIREWTEPVFEAFLKVLDFINQHADSIETGGKLLEAIATYLSSRAIFGQTEDGEGAAIPAAALAIHAELDVVRQALAA